MDSGCSPSIRRPRSHSSRKPRLGSHFLFELDNANGLDTLHEKDVLTTLHSKKACSLQEISVVRNLCRKYIPKYSLSNGHRAHKVASKAKEGTEIQTFKLSHRSNRQGGLCESEYESRQDFKETHESSEGIANGMSSAKGATAVFNRCHGINTKDINQLVRQSHDDKASCKPDLSSRTQSHRKRVVPRKFHDDDTTKDRCARQKDSAAMSMGPNSSRDECMKYNVELAPNSELVSPPSRRLHTIRLENKVVKTGSSLEVDGTDHRSDERAFLIPEMMKRSTTRESPFVSEARRRHQHNTHSQEILLDRGDSQNRGDESSGENAVSGQITFEVVQSMLINSGAVNQGALDVNDRRELQVPMVRKSSRIPKKRILDGDEEAPLRRPRKKLESEQAIEHSEQEESTDDGGNVQLAGDCSERELIDAVGDGEFAHEFCQREFLNSSEIAEPFLVEKKELPLTARQRALRISKEGGDLEGSIVVGAPDASQQRLLMRRQKENLSEAEQAIKKEEAARRRKQQMEKNAKEIQAVAIQKILGQESSRKKREEKLQKQRQEIEQEKQAAAMAPAVNSIRWVMGPSGNVVSFSQDVELPKIFSGPCSYPQEREKCAGPSCNNVYKYRDSKTRLPLCSLQCYRAVQELPSTGPAF